MESPLKKWRNDIAMRSRARIIKKLLDYKRHKYSDLKDETGLARSTLSKYLEELVKKKVVIRKLDVESGEWPIPVFYKLGIGIPGWDMWNLALKGGLLNSIKKRFEEEKTVIGLLAWLARFDSFIDLSYTVVCGELLEQEIDDEVSEVTTYILIELQTELKHMLFDELQRRKRNGENISKEIQVLEKKLIQFTEKYLDEDFTAYDRARESKEDRDMMNQWSKIYDLEFKDTKMEEKHG